MEGLTSPDSSPLRRPRTPQERRALWKEVQAIWHKRSQDAQDVIAKMRDEWEREPATPQRH